MRISRAKARDWFGQARSARLATAGSDGAPHLVPVTFALTGEFVGTAVDHKPKTTRALRRLRNIAENPRVCLLVDHYEEDWGRLWWVRADGTATLHEPEEHPELLRELRAKYPQYTERPPEGPLVTVHVDRWSGWSAADGE